MTLNYTTTQNPKQVSQFKPQFRNIHGSPMYVPPHVFHHYNSTTTSFSPAASPPTSTFSLQSLSQLGCANYNSHTEDEFEDDKSANQQETDENNISLGNQNILNRSREQQQQPKKKTNTLDIDLLMELVRNYPCIWNVKLREQSFLVPSTKAKGMFEKLKKFLSPGIISQKSFVALT